MSYEQWENQQIDDDARAKGYVEYERHEDHLENNVPHPKTCWDCVDDWCPICLTFDYGCEPERHTFQDALQDTKDVVASALKELKQLRGEI